MRPYGSKDSDSIQAVKSCVDDFRRGRRPVSGVAGWLSRPEWAGVGVLVAIALVAVPAVWRRFSGRLGRRPPSEVRGHVQFSGRPREAFLERVWSQRIVNGLERSRQHATEMHLDRACGSGWWRRW